MTFVISSSFVNQGLTRQERHYLWLIDHTHHARCSSLLEINLITRVVHKDYLKTLQYQNRHAQWRKRTSVRAIDTAVLEVGGRWLDNSRLRPR